MNDIYHGGISAGGDMHIGGDVDASINLNETVSPVGDDLRHAVEDLLDALAAAGLAFEQPIGRAALDLRDEITGGAARLGRIERLLALIERNAGQVAVIAAAIAATRMALEP